MPSRANYNGHEDSIASALSKMTNLEELKLRTVYLLQRHLPKIGQNLKNLRKLTLEK